MGAASQGDELIDVVVRLPRRAIEESLLAMPAAPEDTSKRRLVAAKAILAGRNRRATCFGGVRFSDPSWDIILELYVANREHRALAVTQLCSLSGSSTTTALRHIENLEANRYVVRKPDPEDRRRIIVLMEPPLIDALERWLDLHSASSWLDA